MIDARRGALTRERVGFSARGPARRATPSCWSVPEAADEAAFEALVRRHGPMVLRVCRRCSATRATSRTPSRRRSWCWSARRRRSASASCSASWLYGVAYKVSMRARSDLLRRRGRETTDVEAVESPTHYIPRRKTAETGQVLDQELNRLPEKYRAPLVLCYFKERTHDQAAAELRWPVEHGAESRLRGAASCSASGHPPRDTHRCGDPRPVPRTVAVIVHPSVRRRRAGDRRGGGGFPAARRRRRARAGALLLPPLPGSATTLAQGVLTTMALTQIKVIGAGLVAAWDGGVGAGAWSVGPAHGAGSRGTVQPAPPRSEPPEPDARPVPPQPPPPTTTPVPSPPIPVRDYRHHHQPPTPTAAPIPPILRLVLGSAGRSLDEERPVRRQRSGHRSSTDGSRAPAGPVDRAASGSAAPPDAMPQPTPIGRAHPTSPRDRGRRRPTSRTDPPSAPARPRLRVRPGPSRPRPGSRRGPRTVLRTVGTLCPLPRRRHRSGGLPPPTENSLEYCPRGGIAGPEDSSRPDWPKYARPSRRGPSEPTIDRPPALESSPRTSDLSPASTFLAEPGAPCRGPARRGEDSPACTGRSGPDGRLDTPRIRGDWRDGPGRLRPTAREIGPRSASSRPRCGTRSAAERIRAIQATVRFCGREFKRTPGRTGSAC